MGTTAQRAKRKDRRPGSQRRLTNVQVDEVSLVDSPAVPEATFVIAKRLTEDEVANLEKELAADERVEGDTITAGEIEKLAAEATEAGTAEPEQDAIAKDGEPAAETEVVAEEPLEKAANASVARAFVESIQALRKVASSMDSSGLHQLAQLMEYVRFAFQEVPAVANELNKCAELSAEIVAEITKKSPAERLVDEFLKRLDARQSVVVEKQGSAPVPVVEPTAQEPVPVAKQEPVPVVVPAPVSVLSKAAEIFAQRQATRANQQQSQLEAEAIQRISKIASKLDENLSRAMSLGKRLDKAMGKAS